MDEVTARLALPLLAAGQAQKEMTHNEALARLDLLVQAAVEEVGRDAPPDAPAEGACWIVGATPGGAWTGQPHAIAGWTAGGWRFATAVAGMQVWDKARGQPARFDGATWASGRIAASSVEVGGEQVLGARQPAIAEPVDGLVIDAEARTALAAILAALRAHGLIAD